MKEIEVYETHSITHEHEIKEKRRGFDAAAVMQREESSSNCTPHYVIGTYLYLEW